MALAQDSWNITVGKVSKIAVGKNQISLCHSSMAFMQYS
jgi:hypothetical protein